MLPSLGLGQSASMPSMNRLQTYRSNLMALSFVYQQQTVPWDSSQVEMKHTFYMRESTVLSDWPLTSRLL